MRRPKIQNIIDPVGIDKAFAEINTKLLSGLSWLDGAYGKTQKLKRTSTESRDRYKKYLTYPGIYTGSDTGNEYETMKPSDHLGNFSFFVTYDPDDVNRSNMISARTTTTFGLIFWFDYRKVYGDDWKGKTLENVKNDLLEFFRKNSFIHSMIGENFKFYEEAENIYKGFTDTEIDNQFLMRPYGGLRIEGSISFNEISNCQ